MKDSPKAVIAPAKSLRYTATRARSARLNWLNVKGVLNPVNPRANENGNADPPAGRFNEFSLRQFRFHAQN